jgi:hypothetical protein
LGTGYSGLGTGDWVLGTGYWGLGTWKKVISDQSSVVSNGKWVLALKRDLAQRASDKLIQKAKGWKK